VIVLSIGSNGQVFATSAIRFHFAAHSHSLLLSHCWSMFIMMMSVFIMTSTSCSRLFHVVDAILCVWLFCWGM